VYLYFKNNRAKFHPEDGRPNKKNKTNKMRSDMGSFPAPKIWYMEFFLSVTTMVYRVGCSLVSRLQAIVLLIYDT